MIDQLCYITPYKNKYFTEQSLFTVLIVIQNEGNIHDQPLEEFYQTADTVYPTQLPKYTGSSIVKNRIQSAPAHRTKMAKPFKTPHVSEERGKKEKTGSSRGHRTPGGKVSQMGGLV